MDLDWVPRPQDAVLKPDVDRPDWDEATIHPPEGHDQTEWITMERHWILPAEECR